MSELSDIERAEVVLWDAVSALYGPNVGSKTQAAAQAVEALAAYREAVEGRINSTRPSREIPRGLAIAV